MSLLTCLSCGKPASVGQILETTAFQIYKEDQLEDAKKQIVELEKELAIARGTFDPYHDYAVVSSSSRTRRPFIGLSKYTSKENGEPQSATSPRDSKNIGEPVQVGGEAIRQDEVGRPFYDRNFGWKFMDSDMWISGSYDSQEAAEKARTKYKEKYNR